MNKYWIKQSEKDYVLNINEKDIIKLTKYCKNENKFYIKIGTELDDKLLFGINSDIEFDCWSCGMYINADSVEEAENKMEKILIDAYNYKIKENEESIKYYKNNLNILLGKEK